MGDRIAGFLNKKPWHPSSFRNQEKTWLAEQRAEKEEAALRERIAEIKEKEEEESRSGGGWVAAADNPVRKDTSKTAPKRSGAADLLARARPAGASTDKELRRTEAAARQQDAAKRAEEKRKAENAEKRRRKKAKKRQAAADAPPPPPVAPPPAHAVAAAPEPPNAVAAPPAAGFANDGSFLEQARRALEASKKEGG